MTIKSILIITCKFKNVRIAATKKILLQPWPSGSVGWITIPMLRRVKGSIPGQGTYLGCGFYSPVGRQKGGNRLVFLTSVFLSLSLTLPLSFSSESMNISFGEV